MAITRLPPTPADVEPVYMYDDPTLHPIPISGIFIDQKANGRIRSISSTPQDMDRLTQTPLLFAASNLDYATNHAGGPITQYQRSLDMTNVGRIRDWWSNVVSLSANPSLIWLPAGLVPAGFDSQQHPTCNGVIQPAQWAVQECHCGQDATQYGPQYADLFFDHCRECGWNGRPGRIIDGQHRIRGMADITAPNNGHEEQILISLMINQPPLAVNEMDAARMFIEINAGGRELKQLHKDYLASHFGILHYSEQRNQSAYSVARDLNRPAQVAPNTEWHEDTAAVPKRGRVQLMPNTPNCDYLTAWRIVDWIMDVVDKDYIAIDPVTGNSVAGAVYNWPAPANLFMLEASLRNELSSYLRAITQQWSGAMGPRTAPKWFTNRTATGDLQSKGVLRTLLNLMPTILRRIDINGGARDIPTFEAELSLLNNISWTGSWNNNLRGDPGISRVSKVLQKLMLNAPYTGAVAAPQWPAITAWFTGQHDPFTVISFNSSTVNFDFEIETTCSIEPAIVESLSILGEGNGIVSIRITPAGGGGPGPWQDYTHKVTAGTNSILYAGVAPAVGDTIEVQVKVGTALNDTLVQDNDTLAGASVSTIVV